ncbi:hypothetical protein BAY61_22265 [Prauserella marina]|uniref:Uncharacterized protein n=1 Tax=Prauserella marina TaxID=530584 RepID=A0A222VTM9_9PSEU|nr:DUF2975 domain-containing protein [Prauserella marina]ASR37268.1 hypothetical protein BAY61_22265 [Prauserella marina]PWV72603.1 hypothetical protein DES30_110203 [Prauserella marina]SDD76205.1 Protein of unknown function [Prauserella marina]
MRTEWNPLGLLTRITRVVTWGIGLAALAVAIAGVAALGWLPGTGAKPVCTDAAGGAGPLASGAYSTRGGARVCVDDPTFAQQAAGLGQQLPQAIVTLIALVLLLRFLRAAAREGPYAASVPRALSSLGWFVLIGVPLAGLLLAVSGFVLRGGFFVGSPGDGWPADWFGSFPWWSIAAGVTALTFAHILRIGVRMREELEGTI